MTDLPTINLPATGTNIKTIIKTSGLKVTDIQDALGFNTPQSIFKWMRGDTLPSIDNLIALAHILNITVDRLIITNPVP